MRSAIEGWLDLMRKAVQYGVDHQLIRGEEVRKSTLSWADIPHPDELFPAPIDKACHELRVTQFIKARRSPEPYEDVVAKIADWDCILAEGDKRLGRQSARIYGKAMGKAGLLARVDILQDVVNENAVKWAAKYTNKMVTLITDETKAALRKVIASGIKEGRSIYDIGRQVRPLVGLNERQAMAVVHLRQRLIDKGVPLDTVMRRVERYSAKQLRYRGEMIARTETQRAIAAGTLKGYQQGDVEVVLFEAASDACPVCSKYDGQKFRIGAQPKSLKSAQYRIPVHPNCRCTWIPQLPLKIPKPEKPPEAVPFERASLKERGERLKPIRNLMGSTSPVLCEDRITGKKYVVKHGASPEHAKNELLTNIFYKELGVPVPESYAVEINGRFALATEFKEGKLYNRLRGEDLAKAKEALRKNFVADAWLGNWDVIGLEGDNIIVGNDGAVYRIDNGGGLLFRAQGARKDFGRVVNELTTMANPSVNPSAAAVFRDIPRDEIRAQVDRLAAVMTNDKIDSIVRKVREEAGLGARDALKVRALLAERRDWLVKEITEAPTLRYVGHMDVPFEAMRPEEIEEVNKMTAQLYATTAREHLVARENRIKLSELGEKYKQLSKGTFDWTNGLITGARHLELLRDMARHSVHKDITKVHRGLSFKTRAEYENFKSKFLGQDWHVFERIQGFTTKPGVAEGFASFETHGAIFELKAPRGVTGFDVAPYSSFSGEAEILVSDKIRYRISSVREEGDRLLIELEDVTMSKRMSKADEEPALDLELWPFLSETRCERIWKKRARYLRKEFGYTEDEIRRDRERLIRAMAIARGEG